MDNKASQSSAANESLDCSTISKYRTGEMGVEGMRLVAADPRAVAEIDHDVVEPFLFAGATAVPQHDILQSDSVVIAQSIGITRRWNDALPALYKKSGVERRGSVLLHQASGEPTLRQSFYSKATDANPFGPSTAQRMQAYREYAAPLLSKACEQTILASGLEQHQITHLVTVSCTGFSAPGIDHELIDRLDLSPSIQRTHVGFMGCHGLLNGLRIAGAIAKSNSESIVLVGAVELCSIHQQYSEDPQQLVANALFADGAASYLVAANEDLRLPYASSPIWNLLSSFSYKIPNSDHLMGWEIGDHGFRMSLSPEVPRVVECVLREVIEKWLAQLNYDLDDIDFWAVHPGGPRIIDSVEAALNLSSDRLALSRFVLRKYGNMSSPTLAFVLAESVLLDPKVETCVVLGFGPGLSIEVLLLSRSTMVSTNDDD